MTNVRIALLALVFLLFASAPAFAQGPAASSGSTPLRAGAMSLSLGVPGGGNPYAGGTAGFFYAFSPNVNVGFNVGLGLDTAPADTVFNLLLAPVLKYYLMPGSEITPFWIGQLNFGITSVGDDAVDLSVAGGFGAEWFITSIFSIAGYAGIGIDLLRPNDVDPLAIGTFTSGISAQMYW